MFKEKPFLLILSTVALLAVSTLSCETRSTADRPPDAYSSPIQNANDSMSQTLPSPAQSKAIGIRDVDFKNFTYPWYPSFLKARSRDVTLHDGKLEIEEDRRAGIANLSLQFDDVSHADLTGDGTEEAIVNVAGITGVNRFVGCVFLYGIENDKPKLLWQHEIGDRADGGLRRISVERGMLTLEEYARSEGDGGLCCPRIYVRSNYRWNGSRLQKIESKTFPNEYKTAEFLGYATSHP